MKITIFFCCFVSLLISANCVLGGDLSCLLGKCISNNKCLLNILCLGGTNKDLNQKKPNFNNFERGQMITEWLKITGSFPTNSSSSTGDKTKINQPFGDIIGADPEFIQQKYKFPSDCTQVLENGHTESGVYSIWVTAKSFHYRRLEVYCDMDTDGGGWTVIQRRGNFSKQEDFYRDWASYKDGFGNITKDFWLGNDCIYALSNQASYSIRFDLGGVTGAKIYALYQKFKLGDESSKYTLEISDYDGNAGDAMEGHSGKKFSTKDNGNDDTATGSQCTKYCKGGWWYANCYEANLNGVYKPNAKGDQAAIMWRPWSVNDALVSSEIKLRRI